MTEEYPHLYSEEAKTELKHKISQQGSDFRTTEEDRQEFKRAFLSHVKTSRLTTQYHRTPEAVYADYAEKINHIKSANPDIRHIPTEDLIALRSWTASTHHPIVMNALEGDELPDNPLGLSYAKAIISALNALPDRFIHEGHVYTGDDQPLDRVLGRHKEGEKYTDWSFFATASSKENAWQNRSVEWETHSTSGKCIAEFSIHAHESEVLFPPGTQYLTNKIEEKNSPRHFLSITQEQVD
ncbi:type III secretion system effector XopAI [Rhizobacter sp. Root1221]|uniref:type III secretion system effector XopAI n=1 Tax=Rhizobacter sp. Root1221 TaxID=1736433 RepID=UPI0012F8F361|nr:type III secretion system effector XopAI [Rhizobacter sp. Root1221]